MCPTLRLALHPWAVELLALAEAALRDDAAPRMQQAAAYLLAALLRELGGAAVTLISARQLRNAQTQLARLRGRATADPLLVAHAEAALEQLQALYELLVLGPSG